MQHQVYQMKNSIVLILFFTGCIATAWSQTPIPSKKDPRKEAGNVSDTLSGFSGRKAGINIKNKKAKIFDYKIISIEHDSTYTDTTLTLNKEYKYNYLRNDDFNLIPFANLGQTYNSLRYDFKEKSTLPIFGARARHFNYFEVEDINYYYVPTPLTELFYKTGFEQGQLLDAFFTVNTSKQFNFSVAYKALRSLGKYQNALTSTGNLRFTTNYKTKNNKYQLRAHAVFQDLLNQENGGIADEEIVRFESGDPEFKDRSIFQVNFEDAENILKGRRYYVDHVYNLISKKDSIRQTELRIGNELIFEDRSYQFDQTSQNSYFGDAFKSSNLRDRVTLEEFKAQVYATYLDNTLGNFKVSLGYSDLNYGYNKIVILDSQTVPNRIRGNAISLKGNYQNSFGKLNVEALIDANVTGDFDGNTFSGTVSYALNEDNSISFGLFTNSRKPNYNFLLYQSDYENYNWVNNFKNITTKSFSGRIELKKIVNLEIDYNSINNYSYFQQVIENSTKPFQTDQAINYLNIKVGKEIRYGKFALANTIAYQKVIDEESILNVPDLITRNTLYYSNHFFKKALFLQTGVTLKYFTKYHMNAYDPLLAEFYVQNDQEFGGFPMFDFFINAKIRQTRIYLKAEHFNSSFTGYNYYSAPNNPYRDFTVRFGLVWNFFL